MADGFFKLPYRVIFSVATLNSLYIYDTESSLPIAVFGGLHYAAITDIAWSVPSQYAFLQQMYFFFFSFTFYDFCGL